eukprot:comp24129_c1_seq2/m.43812 comp24129_c1_seq2/g.43812  ORF comp24129_c1_seq2/g.43812 comp24129_c1_seq2/m.43812 type:complete len:309 (+) comp24129_c1_seq2:818-1744(+)
MAGRCHRQRCWLGRFADILLHLGQPEGQQAHPLLQQGGTAVHKLAEPQHGLDQVAPRQLGHPCGHRCTPSHLDLQHGIGEVHELVLGDGVVGRTHILAAPAVSVLAPLTHHHKVRVKCHPHLVVCGVLECCAVVCGAHSWAQTLAGYHALHLIGQLHRSIDLFLRASPCLHLLHPILQLERASHKPTDVFLFQHQPLRQTVATTTLLPVCFPLHVDLLWGGTVVAETDCLRTILLLIDVVVMLQLFVVIVDRGDGVVIALAHRRVLLVLQHRQVLQDVHFHRRDVVRVHPVLGCAFLECQWLTHGRFF